MGRGYDRPSILGTAHKSHAVITERTIKETSLPPKRLFHGSHKPIGTILPPAGGGVCRDRRWIRKLGRQPVPESIVAQGAANEHFAGFDRSGEFQNRHDFQLPAVEGLAILWIIMHEATPLTGQRVGRHAINLVIVAVRRLFVRHGSNEREQISRRCRCLQRQDTGEAQPCATPWLQCRPCEGPPILLLVTQVLGAVLRQLIPTAASGKQCLQSLHFFSWIALAPVDNEGIVKRTDQ